VLTLDKRDRGAFGDATTIEIGDRGAPLDVPTVDKGDLVYAVVSSLPVLLSRA